MRKIKFLILSFLTLGMTACFYQEDHGKAPDVPITFDPVVMANTRAEGEASRQDEPFRQGRRRRGFVRVAIHAVRRRVARQPSQLYFGGSP